MHCLQPPNKQAGRGAVTFVLWMKKQKLRKPGTCPHLLRATSTWLTLLPVTNWSCRSTDILFEEHKLPFKACLEVTQRQMG